MAKPELRSWFNTWFDVLFTISHSQLLRAGVSLRQTYGSQDPGRKPIGGAGALPSSALSLYHPIILLRNFTEAI